MIDQFGVGLSIKAEDPARGITPVSWSDSPKSLRVQILEDIVAHSTPTGCVTDTPDAPRYLRLLPKPLTKAVERAKRVR